MSRQEPSSTAAPSMPRAQDTTSRSATSTVPCGPCIDSQHQQAPQPAATTLLPASLTHLAVYGAGHKLLRACGVELHAGHKVCVPEGAQTLAGAQVPQAHALVYRRAQKEVGLQGGQGHGAVSMRASRQASPSRRENSGLQCRLDCMSGMQCKAWHCSPMHPVPPARSCTCAAHQHQAHPPHQHHPKVTLMFPAALPTFDQLRSSTSSACP